MIKSRDVVRALGEYGLADWVVIERDQTIACVDEMNRLRRSERRVLWQLTVHHDSPTGRGSAYVTLDAAEGDASTAVRQAVTLARASVGPAWVSQPAAAPARVKLDDASISSRDPLVVATEIVRGASRPPNASAQITAQVLHENVSVASRQGVRTQWTATLLRAEALVTTRDRSMPVSREARQLADLGVGEALSSAAKDLDALASASALAPGPCSLVLRPDAMLHGGLGVWAAFVSQADAVVERQGLTRYRERAPIVQAADRMADPLTLASDGARDFGVRSAPVGDQGDAVRRFALVQRGIAAGLGLSPREAALRGRDPNGGVRNLVVETGAGTSAGGGAWSGASNGAWSGAVDASAGRIVEIRRLRSLSMDPYTGDASLEILLALDHTNGNATPVAGGSLRIDMIAALARARRSTGKLTRGPYVGPDAVWIDRADIVA